ncbi:IS701 family transposase [Streptomyces sp. NPDC006879]|uniref:IS701 family transposase n=1 Tax=Streptomyces sp. NPDC006879 TaxID=3364767 RepID=UPI0036CA82BC
MRSTILRHERSGQDGHGWGEPSDRPRPTGPGRLHGTTAGTAGGNSADPGPEDTITFELFSGLFSSMPRSDQRRKAMHYVRGLLGAEGRKSIRNIAALIGGDAAEQSLHHFISSSTWDWAPVRRALAQHIERVAPPQAYVVHPMIIPKAGETSVGVERRFVPELGQVINAQQAVGVWAAAPDWSSPLSWRLHLSSRWLEDQRRRNLAAIPESTLPESLEQCSVEAYLGMIRGSGLPIRPLVMDAREADVLATVHRLRAAGTPMLLRVSGSVRLTVTEAVFPRRGASMTAQQIMSTVWHMRHLDPRRPPAPEDAESDRTASLVAVGATLTADTRRPGPAGQAVRTAPALSSPPGRAPELLLLGVAVGGQWPAELWLTDLTSLRPAELLQLIRLTHRVDRDLTEIADQVGIRDFSGRSFTGWHRHATLASAAHAIAVLSGRPNNHHAHPTVAPAATAHLRSPLAPYAPPPAPSYGSSAARTVVAGPDAPSRYRLHRDADRPDGPWQRT